MKKKNGFTLIEIIIMVALLLVVALMFANNLEGLTGSQTNKAYDRLVNTINVASHSYVSAKSEIMNEIQHGKGFTKLTIQELIESGYLDKNLIDPRNDEPINRSEVAIIKLNCEGELDYKFPVSAIENNVAFIESTPLVVDVMPTSNFTNLNTIGLRMTTESGTFINLNQVASKNQLTNPGDIAFISASYQDSTPGIYQILYNYMDNASVCRIHIREVVIY